MTPEQFRQSFIAETRRQQAAGHVELFPHLSRLLENWGGAIVERTGWKPVRKI